MNRARQLVASRAVASLAMLLAMAVAMAAIGWSLATGGLAAVLVSGEVSAAVKVEAVRQSLAAWGWGAPMAYVALVIVEVVVAPIPGLALYAPGGMIFGGFWGGLLALVGNVLGASIATSIANSLARPLFGPRLAEGIDRYRPRLERRGVAVICLLRINPLTSSDLVSYAAGLAGISVPRVMLGTLLGMAPLCFAQAYLSEALFDELPWLIYPLLALTAGYLVAAVLWLRRSGRE